MTIADPVPEAGTPTRDGETSALDFTATIAEVADPALAETVRAIDDTPVFVLNGPNLGRLGRRQPEIYGSTTHDELAALCIRAGRDFGLAVQVRQSDSEADLISWLSEAADESIPVILNAGGLSHTSIALADAAAGRTAPLIELHISNVHAREEFRHHSYLSAVASGVIIGLGVEGYVLALSWLSSRLAASHASSAGR